MNSYNTSAVGGHYHAYSTGFKATPRKTNDEITEKSTSPKKEAVLGKDAKNEHFNYLHVAGITGVGAIAGLSLDFFTYKRSRTKDPLGLLAALSTALFLAGGFVFENLRSMWAKKHNAEQLDKL
jgi:hypothetical protein